MLFLSAFTPIPFALILIDNLDTWTGQWNKVRHAVNARTIRNQRSALQGSQQLHEQKIIIAKQMRQFPYVQRQLRRWTWTKKNVQRFYSLLVKSLDNKKKCFAITMEFRLQVFFSLIFKQLRNALKTELILKFRSSSSQKKIWQRGIHNTHVTTTRRVLRPKLSIH